MLQMSQFLSPRPLQACYLQSTSLTAFHFPRKYFQMQLCPRAAFSAVTMPSADPESSDKNPSLSEPESQSPTVIIFLSLEAGLCLDW